MIKERRRAENKIQYLKMLALYEKEAKNGDVAYRKRINKFRNGIGLKPEYLEEKS